MSWWTSGAYCLAKPGEIYAVYLPEPMKVKIKLEPGTYNARWFSALTGQVVTAGLPFRDRTGLHPSRRGLKTGHCSSRSGSNSRSVHIHQVEHGVTLKRRSE